MVVGGQLLEGYASGDRYCLGGGAHGAGNEAWFVGCRVFFGHPTSECGGVAVETPGLVGKVILGQDHRRRAEGIGFDDVGAGFQVAPMNVFNDVRPGYDQVFVATFVLRAAKVVRTKIAVLDGSAHGSINHEQAIGQRRFQFILTGIYCHKCLSCVRDSTSTRLRL